jgi:serine/threonine-protein kinase
VGTPNFLSPEQVSGKVVPASDQYALALLLYVCLTKRHPFEELDGLPLIRAIERGEIKPPRSFRPEIPEELERIILKAMHTDPAQRFGSMREFGQKIWPWGSQLGQGLWKKYYFETPLGQRPRIDPKRSTTGIPLVLRIAQGEVPMSAATAVVDFQRTTVVQRDTTTGQTGSGSTTLDDPDARAAAEADGGMSSGTVNTVDDPDARPFKPVIPSAPSGWEWQDPSSGSSASSHSSHVGAKKRLGRAKVAVVAAGLLLGIAGVLVAGRALHRPQIASEPTKALEAPVQPPPVEQPTHPAAPPTPVTAQPTSIAGTAAKGEAEPSSPTPKTDAREERAKRSEHAHSHRRAVKENDWAKDPNGNPIPPM